MEPYRTAAFDVDARRRAELEKEYARHMKIARWAAAAAVFFSLLKVACDLAIFYAALPR